MKRSYIKVMHCCKVPWHKHTNSEILNLKIAEAIELIQLKGGDIINFSLVQSDDIYTFTVLYEDNGYFDIIDDMLKNVIFNFDELK